MSGIQPTTADLTLAMQLTTVNVTTLPRPFSKAAGITSAVFLLPMMAFGIAANTLTLVVVFSSKRLRTVVNILIISLSLSDLMSAVISPLNMYRRTWGFDEWGLPGWFCRLFGSLDIWTSGVTALHILTFSFIRLVSIKWPYKYKRIKKSTVKIIISCIWLLTFFCGAVPGWIFYKAGTRTSIKWPACTLNRNWVQQFAIYSLVTYPTLVFIPMITTAVITALTVFVMMSRRASRRQKENQTTFEPTRKQQQEARKKAERKENNAMLQLGLIAGSFMFGYIPITSYAFYTTGHATATSFEEAVFDWNYGVIAYILVRVSECLNPIFYNIASNKMRRETFKILAKCCCCYRREIYSTKGTEGDPSFSETTVGSKRGTAARTNVT